MLSEDQESLCEDIVTDAEGAVSSTLEMPPSMSLCKAISLEVLRAVIRPAADTAEGRRESTNIAHSSGGMDNRCRSM